MDGQQVDAADADRIATRDLAPPRRFSTFGPGTLVCLAMGLPFVLLLIICGLPSVAPMRWVLLCGFGIGAMLYIVAGGQRVAAAWAWPSFRAKCREEARETLTAFAVHPLAYWDGDAGHMSAGNECWPTGVAWDGQFIYVLDRGVGARIPPSMVRQWRWSVEQAGTSAWLAVGSAAQVMLAEEAALDRDSRNQQRAATGNGLFLSVRDVDRPTWQFQTSDVGTLQRWAELLTQMFEGQPSTPSLKEVDAGGSEAHPQPMFREARPAPAEVETAAESRAENLKLGASLAVMVAVAALLVWGVWPVR